MRLDTHTSFSRGLPRYRRGRRAGVERSQNLSAIQTHMHQQVVVYTRCNWQKRIGQLPVYDLVTGALLWLNKPHHPVEEIILHVSLRQKILTQYPGEMIGKG